MSHGHPEFRGAPRDQLRARCAPRGTVAGMKIKPGGVRRLDRVLAADYLAGLERRPLGDVRSLRREAEQEETDLSYTRRLIHGRIDILRAEQRRRTGDIDNIVDHLPTVLAGEGRLPVHGLGRYTAVEPLPLRRPAAAPALPLEDRFPVRQPKAGGHLTPYPRVGGWPLE